MLEKLLKSIVIMIIIILINKQKSKIKNVDVIPSFGQI